MTNSLRFFPILFAAGIASAQGLPGMAAGILEQTALARQAVTTRDRAAAIDHVKRAAVLATEIQAHASPGNSPQLIPVSRDIETTTTYGNVKGGKDKPVASRLKRGSSAREVVEDVTERRLDVTAAASHLQAAQTALEREDWTTADAALAAISEGIVETRADTSSPLLKARGNLEMARTRLAEGKPKDAAAPLRAAAEAMSDYEKNAPGPHREEAASMRTSMEKLAREIGKNSTTALAQIDAWLDPINSWSK